MWCQECAPDIPRARHSGPASKGYRRCAIACFKTSSVQHPGVFGAATLARIDDERSAFEGDARKAAGHDADAVAAGEHEGTQVDMARRNAFLDAGRAGGQR